MKQGILMLMLVCLFCLANSLCKAMFFSDDDADMLEPMPTTPDAQSTDFPRFSFDKSIVESFTYPNTSRPQPGQLIMVETASNTWNFGTVADPARTIFQNYVPVFITHNNVLAHFKLANLRALHTTWQWIWHPKPPDSYLRSVLHNYMPKHAPIFQKPFIESLIIPRKSIIIPIGDLHGSIESLMSNIEKFNLYNIIDGNGKIDPRYYIIFLGDYTDRSPHGAYVWSRLMEFKDLNPDQVFLVRGNHETYEIASSSDFFAEWQSQFTYDLPQLSQQKILELLYSSLPQVVLLGVPIKPRTSIIQQYKYLMFCHGGIEPTVSLNTSFLKAIALYNATRSTKPYRHYFSHNAPSYTGFLWSDFHANLSLYDTPKSVLSGRGDRMRSYNTAAAQEYIEKYYSDHPNHQYKLDAIIRAHQHIPGGVAHLLDQYDVSGLSDWQTLQDKQTISITKPSVFTLTSSPEGLSGFGCREDAYACISCSKQGTWQLEPHVSTRPSFIPDIDDTDYIVQE